MIYGIFILTISALNIGLRVWTFVRDRRENRQRAEAERRVRSSGVRP